MKKRLFFALELNPEDKLHIENWRVQNLSSALKFVATNNLHITLCFIGMVEEELQWKIQTMAKQIQGSSIDITLNQLQFWPKPKILCLTPTNSPDAINQLANTISNAMAELGFKPQYPHYQPHLTLCRKADDLVHPEKPLTYTFKFSDFCLYESISSPVGVTYKVIERYSLK